MKTCSRVASSPNPAARRSSSDDGLQLAMERLFGPGQRDPVLGPARAGDAGLHIAQIQADHVSVIGRPLAFLEYVQGEYAWRPVDARGWLFVHCLWVYPRGQHVRGLGTRLLQACVE